MRKISLNGPWQLRVLGWDKGPVAATVPGSVYHDLLAAGEIPDPFYRDNEMDALKLMDNDFSYTREIDVPEGFLQADAVLLRAEGLDTLAEISVNGKPVGKADNMHRIWEFDVKNALHTGKNTIEALLCSPTKFIKKAYAESPADGSTDAMVGFPSLRKAHCMFGWDWGPRLPDAGIWRDIALLSVNDARIRDVYVTQKHEEGKVTCRVETHVTRLNGKPVNASVTVTGPDGKTYTGQGLDCEITINNPQLWWPAGYGGQPLYTVEVTLASGNEALDAWQRRIGLRTLTMRREKDEWGESFCHRVNGVDVFAMGADYIPEDNLLPRVTPERTRRLLLDARAANMNMIRVWGGGYYPDDFFYDICDELGILVWRTSCLPARCTT